MDIKFYSYRSGFSLVELSIVLVILGLLVGGILSGQALIRAAEIRGISTEYQRIFTATTLFRDKYFTIPGDFRDGTRVWGLQVSGSGCVSNSGAAVGTPGTCDGNGNLSIDHAVAANESSERFQFWRQLALAGLIEGKYDGFSGPDGIQHGRIGITVPASKVANAGYGVFEGGIRTADFANYYTGDYTRIITFGAAPSPAYPYYPAIRPEDAWNVDTKMDDGKPGLGVVRSWRSGSGGTYAPNCALDAPAATAEYNLTNSTLACSLLFLKSI